MRLLPVLWACALAACSIDVDGAPCSVPGTTGDCPGGQACGNDRRCSARALACAASRCTPGVSDLCLDPSGGASGAAFARRCEGTDAVCGTWVTERCDDRGLLCGRDHGAAHCECPANATRQLVVLPEGGRPDVPPFASGVSAPPRCAIGTLTGALARAGAVQEIDPSAPVTVLAAGAPAGGTRTFSGATGERFPLVIPPGVALRSDALVSGGRYEILFDAASATRAAVELRSRSSFQDFTVRNGDQGGDQVAIDVVCATTADPVSLSSIVVEARGAGGVQLGTGVRGSSCSLRADLLVVRDVGGPGIAWGGGAGSSSRWSLSRGTVSGCAGAGIVVKGGDRLDLYQMYVADNDGRGVDASAGGMSWVDIQVSKVVRNGDTGLALQAWRRLSLAWNIVAANGATTPWGGASVPSGIARRAGGVVLLGSPPPDAGWGGNRIYANRGDQVLIVGPSSGTWNLDASYAACFLVLSNQLGCYDPTPAGTTSYRGIVGVDATVTARDQYWDQRYAATDSDVALLPSGVLSTSPVCAEGARPAAIDCGSEGAPPTPSGAAAR